jgi:hypothetical protein
VRRPDLATLISGVSVVILGAVLLLDRAGDLSLDFSTLGPLMLTVLGVILLVTGLARGDGA